MEFSQLYKHTGSDACQWSPDGAYVAVPVQMRLVIRLASTLEIVQVFVCSDVVETIEWDISSRFVACGLLSRGVVQIWSLEDVAWSCILQEGEFGLQRVLWAPDGGHILTFSKDEIQITIWSILSKKISRIPFPKSSHKVLKFSPDGTLMAVAVRSDGRDVLWILCCSIWEIKTKIESRCTDLYSLEWSSDNRFICLLDTPIQGDIYIYSFDGRLFKTLNPSPGGLGTRSLSFSPSSQFLALGGYDQKLILLNTATWTAMFEQSHKKPKVSANTKVYSEENGAGFVEKQSSKSPPSRFVILPKLPESATCEVNERLPNQKIGVFDMAWSLDSHFLITRDENMPNNVWIWDILEMSLISCIVFKFPVKTCCWLGTQNRLAICCGNTHVYLWSPETCSCVPLPYENFSINRITCNKSGNAMLLSDFDRFCTCNDV